MITHNGDHFFFSLIRYCFSNQKKTTTITINMTRKEKRKTISMKIDVEKKEEKVEFINIISLA